MALPLARPRGSDSPEQPTPICRCRVLYLGSAVPHASKDGLQGIQGPLHELYPSDGVGGANGIDSWLSVWSNGLLLENVDEQRSKVTRFFPIETLHYCAAVRHVLVPGPGGVRNPITHFMPLDAPFARVPHPMHPPLFAAILRRTTGLKVLECHVFMCRREAPANALVRSCFHVYADAMAAKQLDGTLYDSIYGYTGKHQQWDESEAKLDVEERDETSEGGATPTPPRSTPTRQPDPRRMPINGTLPTINPLSVDVGDGGMNGHMPGITSTPPQETSRSLYGTARRNLRPRQRVMPAAPPPPPRPDTGTGRRRKLRETEYSDRTRSASAAALTRPPPSPSQSQGGGDGGWRDWTPSDDPHRSYSRAEVYNSFPEGRESHSPPSRTLPSRRHRQPGQPHQGFGPPPPPQRGPLPPPPPGHNLATMSLSRSRTPRELRVFTSPQQYSPLTADSRPMTHQFATMDRSRGWRGGRDADCFTPLQHNTGRNHYLNGRSFGQSMQQEHRSRSQGSLLDVDGEERPHSRQGAGKGRSPHQLMADLDLNGDENPHTRRGMNGVTRRA